MERAYLWLPRVAAVLAFAVCALIAPAAGTDVVGDGSALVALTDWLAKMLPIADQGYRPRVTGAVCAAGAVLLTARMILRLAERGPASSASIDQQVRRRAALAASLAAAGFLTVALPFGAAASGQPVQGPLAVLIVATAYLAVPVMRGADAQRGLLLALIAGFGLAAHPAYRWALGPPLVLLFAIRLRRGARWPLLVPLTSVVTALSVWLHGPATGTARGDDRMASVALADLATWTIDTLGVLSCLLAVLGAVHLAGEKRGLWPLCVWLAIAAGGAAAAVFGSALGPATAALMITLAVAGLLGHGLFWLGRSAGLAGPYLAGAVGTMVTVAPAMITWATVTG